MASINMMNSPRSSPPSHDKSFAEGFLAPLVPTAEKLMFQLCSDRSGGFVTSTGNHVFRL
jgi:hypothetical protein